MSTAQVLNSLPTVSTTGGDAAIINMPAQVRTPKVGDSIDWGRVAKRGAWHLFDGVAFPFRVTWAWLQLSWDGVAGVSRMALPVAAFFIDCKRNQAALEARAKADEAKADARETSDKKTKLRLLNDYEDLAKEARRKERAWRWSARVRCVPTSIVGAIAAIWTLVHFFALPTWERSAIAILASIAIPAFAGVVARRIEDKPLPTLKVVTSRDFDPTKIKDILSRLGIKALADNIGAVEIVGAYDSENRCYRFQIETPPIGSLSAAKVIADRAAWSTASGIPENRILIELLPTISAGAFALTVFESDPTDRVQGDYPYGPADTLNTFGPYIVGEDLLHKPTMIHCPDGDVGVFGQKGKGKSETTKGVITPRMLDPRERLAIIDFKDLDDYLEYRALAWEYIAGTGLATIQEAYEFLKWVRDVDMPARAAALAEYDGITKVTDEIAGDPRLNPMTIVFEEHQVPFGHPEYRSKFDEVVFDIQSRGRAYGIKFVFATQSPDKHALPARINRQIETRFCHYMEFQTEVAMAIGNDAYEPGGDATKITRKGQAILKGGEGARLITTQSYLLTPDVLRPIVQHALALRGGVVRKRRELLPVAVMEEDGSTGHFLSDVLSVRKEDGSDKAGLWFREVVERLQARYPARYESLDVARVHSLMHCHDIPKKGITRPTEDGKDKNNDGYRFDHIELALEQVRP